MKEGCPVGTYADRFKEDENIPSASLAQNPVLAAVCLRDFFAAQAMVANMNTWNSELSPEYRIKLLEDWVKNYGEANVYKCVALMSYEMADVMMSVRNGS